MMRNVIKGVLLVVGVASMTNAKSQSVLDGVYVKEHIPTKKVISYTYLREADVMWEKRVWRIIDLREKINQPLFFPLQPLSDRWSLWDIIRYHLEKEPGSLTPYEWVDPDNIYNQDGDQFKYPVKYLGPGDTVYINKLKDFISTRGADVTEPYYRYDTYGNRIDSMEYDANGQLVLDASGNPKFVYPPRVDDPITAQQIVQWEIKEDWFFDKQRSVMDVRIVGICPQIYDVDPATKKVKGIKPLFWIYFPELRYIIQNYFVYNRKNDAMRMSFDDLFWKRMFNSYIKKESNVFDRTIPDYVEGVDALLESERIKKEMMEIEHDMWDL